MELLQARSLVSANETCVAQVISLPDACICSRSNAKPSWNGTSTTEAGGLDETAGLGAAIISGMLQGTIISTRFTMDPAPFFLLGAAKATQ